MESKRKSNSVSSRKIIGTQVDNEVAGDYLQYLSQSLSQTSKDDDCYQCKRKQMLKMANVAISRMLTGRQRECFLRSINGERAERIAYDLGLSRATVYKHVRKAKSRLGFLKDFF